MIAVRRGALVGLLATLLGCQEQTPRDVGSPPRPSLDPSAVPTARLVEDLRLDATAEDFSVIRQVFVGPRGQIALPLRQDQQVWIYDSTGRRIVQFGGPGDGPEEFRELLRMGWVGDTLWAHDRLLGRLTFISPTGSLLRTTPLRTPFTLDTAATGGASRDVIFFLAWVLHADGRILGEGAYTREGESSVSPFRYMMRSSEGVARIVADRPPSTDPRWYIEVDGLGTSMPFAMAPFGDVSHDGTRIGSIVGEEVSAEGGTVAVTMLDATGDTLFSRSYPFVGVPVTSSERDSAIAALNPNRGPPNEGPPDLYRRRQEIARRGMPPVHTPVRGFRIGLDGTIWIDLRETPEGRYTLVLNERGDPIGSVLLPANSTIAEASLGRLWVLERDPYDLVSVVRYRVEGLARS